MSSVQRLGTGRSAQFADTGGGGGGAASLDIKSIVKTDGNFSSLNPVPGTTINFTTDRAGVSHFSVSGTVSGNHPIPSDSIGINIDGTSYTLAAYAEQNGSGDDTCFANGLSGSIGVQLAAGSHTAFIFVTQSGLPFIATAANPMTLTVIFPSAVVGHVPVFEGALVTRNTDQSVDAGDVITFNAVRRNDGNLFSLGQPTRLTAQRDGWYNIGAMAEMSLNFNLDYVGFYIRKNGTTILASARDNTNSFFGSTTAQFETTKSVYLAQGDYIEMVADPQNVVTAEAVAEFSIDFWMVLISPAFTPLAAGAFTQIASLEKTDGTFSLGSTGAVFVDFSGVNSLAFTMAQAGDALVMVNGNIATSVSNPGSARLGLMLDGNDLFPAPSEGDGLAAGTTVGGGAFQLHQGCGINAGGGSVSIVMRLSGLSAGLHTLKLRISFSTFGGRVYASTTTPFRMTVLHQ